MADANSPDSPLDMAAGTAGPRATEAFSVLANETRLSILLALWEAYDPFVADNAIAFSELRNRIGMRDSGQFNYHLEQLEGQFIEKTDNGYQLRRAGQQLVRTVIAGAGLTESTIEPTQLEDECTLCGAPTAITYHDEFLYHVCTECPGYFGDAAGHPEGVLSAFELDPAGLTDRDPTEMLHAAVTTGYQQMESAIEGVCGICSGSIAQTLDICSDHDAEGICPNCGRRPATIARFVCTVCKADHQAPPYVLVAHHPAVIGFYYDHGIALQYEVADFDQEQQRRRAIKSHDQELLADDPPRIRVVVECESDELRLILDENLQVVSVEESA